MTNDYYCIYDPISRRYWNGQMPQANLRPTGKLCPTVRFWVPHTSELPKKWSRRSTVEQKLSSYLQIRAVRPDLPEMRLQRYELRPQLTEDICLELLPIGIAASKMYYLHGSALSNDYSSHFTQICPERVCAVKRGTITKSKIRMHFPEAIIGSSFFFISKDDIVLLKLAEPDATYFDLTNFLS